MPNIERCCTVCMLRGKRVKATHIATGPTIVPRHPTQWFECGNHSNQDHPDYPRMHLEPLTTWLERNRLVPGDNGKVGSE
jgi:hypothetical protein